MPQITSRICGVCPTAHHMAATKALDALYQVTPPPAGKKIRELVYSTFMVEDHALHFYFLGGPDFVVGPTAPAAERNVLGVIAKVGLETGRKVIDMRRQLRELMALAGGQGRSTRCSACRAASPSASRRSDQAQFTAGGGRGRRVREVHALEVFDQIVLKNPDYVDLILSDTYTHRTHLHGHGGRAEPRELLRRPASRRRRPTARKRAKFEPAQYLDYVAEHVEPWSYVKFCYLKPRGLEGLRRGDRQRRLLGGAAGAARTRPTAWRRRWRRRPTRST